MDRKNSNIQTTTQPHEKKLTICPAPSFIQPVHSNKNALSLLPRTITSSTLLPRQHLTRAPGKARRHIQYGIPREEIPRPQQQCHGFRRHDREIFWSGKMGEAESVPEHDVGVCDGSVGRGFDPGWKALGGLAGGLRDVATGRVDLVVGICGRGVSGAKMGEEKGKRTFGDMHSVTSEARSLPDQSALSR